MKQKVTTLATRQYSDFDLSFAADPVTGDIKRLEGPEAVKNAVKSLVLTRHYERPFHPELGSRVGDMQFMPLNFITEVEIRKSIEEVINNFEDRAYDVRVVPSFQRDRNAWSAKIFFRIANVTQPIELQVVLDRIR